MLCYFGFLGGRTRLLSLSEECFVKLADLLSRPQDIVKKEELARRAELEMHKARARKQGPYHSKKSRSIAWHCLSEE